MIASRNLSVCDPSADQKGMSWGIRSQMVKGLHASVSGDVLFSAQSLSKASENLANTSTQAGEATNQIASTIQQVARQTLDGLNL